MQIPIAAIFEWRAHRQRIALAIERQGKAKLIFAAHRRCVSATRLRRRLDARRKRKRRGNVSTLINIHLYSNAKAESVCNFKFKK